MTCSKIEIGDNVVIRPGTILIANPDKRGGDIIIEDDVLVGSCVHFYTANHAFSDVNRPIIAQGHVTPSAADTIVVRRGAWIGANVIVLKGVEIGANSVVAAGTVVTKSVPPRTLFAGKAGSVIRRLDAAAV